jgi:hypothetical protein
VGIIAMEAIQYIVMLLLGIALGAVAAWFFLRAGISNAFQQGQGESRAEMAALGSEWIYRREYRSVDEDLDCIND